METRIDGLERVIQATAKILNRPVERCWEAWNVCNALNDFDYDRAMTAFLASIHYASSSKEDADREEALAYVNDSLSVAALLGQVAEEASELATAALKLQRIVMDENPTPVSEDEAISNFIEEMGDLLNSVDALHWPFHTERRDTIKESCAPKCIRWAERIKEKKAAEEETDG